MRAAGEPRRTRLRRRNPVQSASVRQGATDEAKMSAWRPQNPAISLGLAVEYLRKKPAFARLAFGEWSQVLLVRSIADIIISSWININEFTVFWLGPDAGTPGGGMGRRPLRAAGRAVSHRDCVIFNAWAADSQRVHRFMVDTGRKIIEGKRTLYFKRHYPDGGRGQCVLPRRIL